MKKILLFAAISVAGFTTAIAQGDGNPHFNCNGTEITEGSDGSLLATFKVTGLGNTVSATVTVAGNVTFDLACYNYGTVKNTGAEYGNYVKGLSGNRQYVWATAPFTSTDNGNLTGDFSLDLSSLGNKCRPNINSKMKGIASHLDWSGISFTVVSTYYNKHTESYSSVTLKFPDDGCTND